MDIAFFGTKSYDRRFFEAANQSYGHNLRYLTTQLNQDTAALASGSQAVCAFVNDSLDGNTLKVLADQGVTLVAMRCAGYNNVNLVAANQLALTLVRVPAYSPHAVAEHTIALLLALNRKIHRAYNRVREGNFMLEGLLGFDLYGMTAGVIGTGKIGANVVRILRGFGCRVLAHDPFPNDSCRRIGAEYLPLADLLNQANIITLHCPLTPVTHHLIDEAAIATMKNGVVLLNTSRGALIDTKAAIQGLKSGHIGQLGIDVYEEEADLFFEDLSNQVIQDDLFARLTTFPNVLITGHQAFFTREAMTNIAETTLANIAEFEQTGKCQNKIGLELLAPLKSKTSCP